MTDDHAHRSERERNRPKWQGVLVHFYTALGVVCALGAAVAIATERYPNAFFWLLLAAVIDGSDGTLARKFSVERTLPEVDGRRLDDIVDYLTYSFLPLFMLGHAGWLPHPPWMWVSVALLASLFAFCNVSAKQDREGFFVGFPSYWNVVAFYTAIWLHGYGAVVLLIIVLLLSLLSVLPVRFVYPARAPRWRPWFLWGSVAWIVTLLGLLLEFRADGVVSDWLLYLSLIYPVTYLALSVYLDIRFRGGGEQPAW